MYQHGSQFIIMVAFVCVGVALPGRTSSGRQRIRQTQQRCRPLPTTCGASTTHGKSDSLIIWIRDVFCSRKPSTFVCWGQNTSRIQHVPNVTLAPWPARIVSLGCSSWSSSHGIASAARDASAAHWRTTGTRVSVQSVQASISCICNILPYPPQLYDSIYMLHGGAIIARQVLLLGCGVWV